MKLLYSATYFLAVITIVQCLSARPLAAQWLDNFPPEIQSVFKYMVDYDYPEVYRDEKPKIQPMGYEIVDIDQDGLQEVFLWVMPHYHQSPTILIFQVRDDSTVFRMKEGLAPGPLVPFDGEFMDAHKTGKAFDQMTEGTTRDKEALVRSYLKFKTQIVVYKHFYHTANAQDSGGYMDMTYQTGFGEEDKNSCSDFQFSRVRAISSGRIGNTDRPYFVALTGDDIYIYEIESINPDGLFKKNIRIVKKPDDFGDFARNVDGHIRYWSVTNEQKLLDVDFEKIIPVTR